MSRFSSPTSASSLSDQASSSPLPVSAKDPSTGIDLDLNVNHLNGSYNSLFVYHHGRLSPNFFVKTWAVARSLSSSSLGSARNITSYALLLLVLTYLVDIKAIENLFKKREGSGWVDRDLIVQSKKNPTPLNWKQRFSTGRSDGLPAEELVPIGLREALKGFFEFVGRWEKVAATEMVSLRVGKRTKRTRVTPLASMFVEDPFITSKASLLLRLSIVSIIELTCDFVPSNRTRPEESTRRRLFSSFE